MARGLRVIAGSAGGPLFAAAVFDRTTSYNLAFMVFAAGWLIAALLVLVAWRPRARTLPTIPLAHWAITRSGLLTMNIGAPMIGSRIRLLSLAATDICDLLPRARRKVALARLRGQA